MRIPCSVNVSLLLLVAAMIAVPGTSFGQSNPLAEQRKEIERIKDAVTDAGKKYKSGDYDDAGKIIATAQEDVAKLLPKLDNRLKKNLEPILQRMESAHQMLALQGIEIPAMPSMDSKGNVGNGKVSFVKDVAPFLVQQCGRCHIQAKQGRFSMENFAELMKGNNAGVVIFPKDSKASRLVEVIESGDMPRGGGKVSPENLAKLKTWIDEGAVFDGADASARLPTLVQGANGGAPMPEEKLETTKPMGKETVRFARDIAPILLANCKGCHIDAQRVQGGLNMNTFTQLLRGGDSGPMIDTKNPSASLLIKKLKGEAGQRMPAGGRPALSSDQIALIQKWIEEKATFDGESPDARLATTVDIAWAKAATDQELRDRRREQSKKQWNLVAPKVKPQEVTDDEYQILTDTGEEDAKLLLTLVQEAGTTVRKQMKLGTNEPIVRGGVTIFGFAKRYDYGEFGKMAENRTLPSEWSGHWRKQTIDAYAVLHFDPTDKVKTKSILVQLISSLHVGSMPGVPQWFGDGVGRSVVAMTMANEDPRVKEWIGQLPTVSTRIKNPKDLLDGKLGEEDAALTGFALVRTISTGNSKRQYESLLRFLRNGTSFDEAFSKSFMPQELFVRKWLGLNSK